MQVLVYDENRNFLKQLQAPSLADAQLQADSFNNGYICEPATKINMWLLVLKGKISRGTFDFYQANNVFEKDEKEQQEISALKFEVEVFGTEEPGGVQVFTGTIDELKGKSIIPEAVFEMMQFAHFSIYFSMSLAIDFVSVYVKRI